MIRGPWSDQETARLQRLRDLGLTYRECARELERSIDAVQSRCKATGLTVGARSQNGKWSDEEIVLLKRLATSYVSTTRIAIRLGRTKSAVVQKRRELREIGQLFMPPQTDAAHRPRSKRRPCLCCKKSFMSQGPHNRLCVQCRRLSLEPFEEPLQVMLR
jgi:IS30 family transposase